MNKMHLYFRFFILVPLCLLFWGCEKPDTATPLSEVVEKEPVPVAPEPVPAVSAPEPLPEEKTTKEAAEIAEEMPLPEKKTVPVQPPFSDELLLAVQNWQKIPKSVFPLPSVGLLERVNLEARSSDGRIMASSVANPGDQVTVLGISQGKLVVAPAKSNKMRGFVDMDQTDFKQMVAYLFELRKEQRKNLKAKTLSVQSTTRKSTAATSLPQEEDNFIPDPLDFGHGRFCICKECREKRLAKTGSLKTGHGLEP